MTALLDRPDVADTPADMRVSVATARPDRINAQGLNSVLREIKSSLLDLDRVMYPGQSRFEWDVVGLLHRSNSLNMTFSPKRLPLDRPLDAVGGPANALVSGVADLHRIAEIPDVFSPQLVGRVKAIGGIVGDDITHIDLQKVGRQQVGVVDTETIANAVEAVRPAQVAYGSVRGVLDTLSKRKGFRAQIYNPRARRGVMVRLGNHDELQEQIRDLFDHEVEAWGLLTRNDRGQPVSIEVLEIREPERRSGSALALLGIDPQYTGDLTTADFLAEARRAR